MPLVACPLWGQEGQKRNLTPEDYHLWGLLSLNKISPDEQWASYTMSYENNIDTLFVRSIDTHKTYSYPLVQFSAFTKDNFFISLNDNGLKIQNLKYSTLENISTANQFSYSSLTDNLILSLSAENSTNELIIRTPAGKILQRVANVTKFSLSPDEKHLAYATFSNNLYSAMLLDLKQLSKEEFLLINSKDNLDGFTWQKEGKAIAFVGKSQDPAKNKLFYYTITDDKFSELNSAGLSNLETDTYIAADHTLKLTISDDMRKVFFTTKINSTVPENKGSSDVEIWNGNDKFLTVNRQENNNAATIPRTALWVPLSDFVAPITTEELPKMMLTGDQQSVILFNPDQYQPKIFNQIGFADLYMLNLNTFEKKIFLKKQESNLIYVIPSPTGRYISYFKDNNWWVYNIASDSHHNITAKLKTKFTAEDGFYSIIGNTCTIAGWNKEDNDIVLYDQYDLWAIKPDGSASRRLTNGREINTRYRLSYNHGIRYFKVIYDAFKIESIDLGKELILHGQGDNGQMGYFKWDKNSGLKPIVYTDSHVDQLMYVSGKKNILFYREQKFDLSPKIMLKRNHLAPVPFFQSNLQQKKFHWGRSELIEYQNTKGKKIKGVLRYPANYDPNKKYPMIVIIYEQQNSQHHKYVNPTLYNEEGENDNIWSTQGYFVLRPDIIIENNHPGISALDCVTAAIRNVIDRDIINPKKIGLMGHSFGGYETSFIVTQTNLFAAAIPSSGITDLTSFYFTMAKDFSYPNMNRFETVSWKIKKSPFEAPENFYENSPIVHADKIITPLLIWSGKSDNNVDPHQSMELYFALRSLGKKCIMLLYPDEGHGIFKPDNRIDMNERIQQWFGYYLKDNLPAKWINDGIK